MASKTAVLAVRIISDARGAQQGFEDTAKSADKLEGSFGKITKGAGIALAAVVALAAKAGAAASEAQQAAGGVEAVFGAYAAGVQQQAEAAARNVGLAESQYNNLAVVLGSQLKNMGTPMDAVAGQTEQLISLGADLAATFGGTTADAVGALSSLLRGERDPIERYGVSIKQATIDAKKAELGLSGLTGAADTNADATATLALLYDQTGSAAGQFGREIDSAAGSQQVANALWENAAADLGQVLLPIMTAAATAAADLAEGMTENSTAVTILLGVVGGLSAAILLVNGAMKAWAALQVIVTAAQWLWNIALSANPIGLIVIAIGLVIAIIAVWILNWDTLAAATADLWAGMMEGLGEVGNFFRDVFGAIGDWWQGLVDSFENGFDQIIGFIQSVLDWFGKLGGAAGSFLSGNGWQWDSSSASSFASRSAVAAAPDAAMMLRSAAVAPEGLSAVPMSLAGAAGMSNTSRGAEPQTVINLTVQGAVDPDGTARTIMDLLNGYARRNGGLPVAGGRA